MEEVISMMVLFVFFFNYGFYFINEEGVFLNKKPFLYAERFDEGFALVEVADSEYNLLKMDGSLFCKENFAYVGKFNNGFAVVKNFDNKYNYIDKEGNFLSNEWFDLCISFLEEVGLVRKNGLWNIINRNGKIVSDVSFSDYEYSKNSIKYIELIDTNNNKFILYNNGLLINLETNEKTQLQVESRTNFIKKIIREELKRYIR